MGIVKLCDCRPYNLSTPKIQIVVDEWVIIKIMPNYLPFKLDKRFNNYNEFINYKSTIFDFSVDHTKKTNSRECKKADHKMKVQYCYCSNQACFINNENCPRLYKVHICLKSNDPVIQKTSIYSLNKHASSECSKKNVRGITPAVKELVETLIGDYNIRPFKIWMKLQKSKYADKIDVMPTLIQIQTYIKYRRQKLGDTHNLSEIKEAIQNILNKNTSIVFFGETYGDGTDEDHFYLGFTNDLDGLDDVDIDLLVHNQVDRQTIDCEVIVDPKPKSRGRPRKLDNLVEEKDTTRKKGRPKLAEKALVNDLEFDAPRRSQRKN
ncbi:unnamed protein product [Brachionus calyciflorus]|uniref:Uncharacterized protein n=1 Tax=Brachionus calyciflorus TaxID=104777 RepID=A0A814P7Z1_9BILA|nr:unnamed protein product [Brachionus calyciflorus]